MNYQDLRKVTDLNCLPEVVCEMRLGLYLAMDFKKQTLTGDIQWTVTPQPDGSWLVGYKARSEQLDQEVAHASH